MVFDLKKSGVTSVDQALLRKALRLQREIIMRSPVDRGSLRVSYKVEEIRGGYRVLTRNKYAAAIEYGTPPFTPPLQPLKSWGRRVLGSEAAGVAVWNKIRSSGLSPQPHFWPGVESFKKMERNK